MNRWSRYVNATSCYNMSVDNIYTESKVVFGTIIKYRCKKRVINILNFVETDLHQQIFIDDTTIPHYLDMYYCFLEEPSGH